MRFVLLVIYIVDWFSLVAVWFVDCFLFVVLFVIIATFRFDVLYGYCVLLLELFGLILLLGLCLGMTGLCRLCFWFCCLVIGLFLWFCICFVFVVIGLFNLLCGLPSWCLPLLGFLLVCRFGCLACHTHELFACDWLCFDCLLCVLVARVIEFVCCCCLLWLFVYVVVVIL